MTVRRIFSNLLLSIPWVLGEAITSTVLVTVIGSTTFVLGVTDAIFSSTIGAKVGLVVAVICA